ncbi:MAG: ABC transporter ATP-binding protein [Candidatus Bathyarchaeia archaeon]
MPLLRIDRLRTYYSTLRGDVKAVDGVTLDVEKGEALGLAGESGCGKTTLALSVIRLLPDNGRVVDGGVFFDGADIMKLDPEVYRREYRWRRISMVFQGAMNALTPVYRVGDQIAEAILCHEEVEEDEALERARELLGIVGVDPERALSYPHELSGGMRQRVMIAMALANNPEFVIADEPITALDVIVQAQVLHVMNDLRRRLGLTMMLITHDLSVIAETCDSAAIMYAGKLVERGTVFDIFKNPFHPYTQGLVGSFPSIRGEKKEMLSIPGSPPNLLQPPPGCRFHPRCPRAMDICRREDPLLVKVGPGHLAACWLWEGG